jgi:phosphoglycolate phosphatase-like HAD superfamily hydrolase
LKGRRLYLFDIDGTLISTGGAGGGAMRAAFAALWRRADGFDGIEFSGRTDRSLLKQAVTAAGLEGEPFEEQLRRFKRAYYRRLPLSLPAYEGRVLPSVVSFLEQLTADPDASVGLGTGNFRHSASIKLRHYGIDHYFRFGGFGDRAEDRAALIAEGIRSGQRRGRHDIVFVIGDTVHDIVAARANRAVAVGVTTGSASAEVLSAAGADLVLASLAEAPRLLA